MSVTPEMIEAGMAACLTRTIPGNLARIYQAMKALDPSLTSDAESLEWLASNKNAQLYWYGHIYGDDDREPQEWRVDLERGSINGREWETVGRGETPLEAIRAARAKVEQP